MARPGTWRDIAAILDRLERAPLYARLFRERPHLRDLLLSVGLESAEKLGTPRSEIESQLRAQLRSMVNAK